MDFLHDDLVALCFYWNNCNVIICVCYNMGGIMLRPGRQEHSPPRIPRMADMGVTGSIYHFKEKIMKIEIELPININYVKDGNFAVIDGKLFGIEFGSCDNIKDVTKLWNGEAWLLEKNIIISIIK